MLWSYSERCGGVGGIVTKEVAKYWLVAKVTVLMMKWLIVAGGVTDELLNIRKKVTE
ncbi:MULTISPECIES: hypothetical protein [Paenibacillus]|uniref:hypothetical protein n=1 Tax=Paenibacillus TaxID=44249 RepID=UPI0015C3E694|nr:hypothetical protein [Paenibacillus odorifer]